ncbi:MAG: hypothetical protein V1701_11585 [Planctomycetota bacterium]
METQENTGLQPPVGMPDIDTLPANSRLAKAAFISGLLGIIVFALLSIAPPIIAPLNMIGIAIIGIISLLGLLLFLLGAVLGIISLIKIRKSKGLLKGKGWAISGLIIGLIPLLMFGALIIYAIFLNSSSGRYYQAKPFNPAEYKGEIGTIILPYKGESSLTLGGGKEIIKLTTTDGAFKAPVGDYDAGIYEAIGNDEKNIKWIAYTYLFKTKVSVKNGSTEQLDIGPPFTASIDVKNGSDSQVSMTFHLMDKKGNSYSIYNSEPAFQVISQSGAVIWSGKFQSG